MARIRPTAQTADGNRRKTQAAVAVVVLLLLAGGCNQLLTLGDSDGQTAKDCAMALAAQAAPREFIGGGGNGGGFTNGGGFGDGGSGGGLGSSSSSGGSVLDDADVLEYEPGMDLDDVTPDMQATAEGEYGEMQAVGTELIWFDKRTGKPFPWYEDKYEEAKRQADGLDAAEAALEDDC
ncbi:hypothetical protein ABZY09_44640 [Streptomyces sp. NPDC002928]|uniref:hypothetical protein n=1 Tax=Streptomyces sp. NPDC002928 TaxID=3154440 RepID=UPI0033A7A469